MSFDFKSVVAEAAEDLQTDATLASTESTEDTSSSDIAEEGLEASQTDDTTQVEAEAPAEGEEAQDATEAATEATPAQAAAVDAFAKENGLPQGLKEDQRIPYSRVKAINANAVKKAVAPLETKVKEFEAKVQDYEGRLGKVAEFEKLMAEEPIQFLNLLATIPSYKQIFEQLGAASQQAPAQAQTPPDPYASMPQPDGPDGSYTQEGVKALLQWNAEQTQKQVMDQVTKRYEPLAKEREAEKEKAEYYQKVSTNVTKEIERVSAKPLFKEVQPEVERILAEDKTGMSLQDAYDVALFNHLKADREKLHKEWLAQAQKAPKSTAVTGTATKPVAPSGKYNGVSSIRDMVKDAAAELGLE